MSMTSPKPDKKYTYGDYLNWPDEERWEIIDGVPYDMSPAPSTKHQTISMELGGQLWSFLRDKDCQVFAAPFDVRLPQEDENDEDIENVVQPDLSGVPEYWVVFPKFNVIVVYSLDDKGKYQKTGDFASSQILSSELFPGLEINLSQVFGIDD